MSDLKILAVTVDGKLSLALARPTTKISGIDKLVQIVTLCFLNRGKRSIFNPGRTGGLRELLGSNINPDDPQELFADIRLTVNQVERFIKESQTSTQRRPSERLRQLQLVDIVPTDLQEIQLYVAVVNEENQYTRAVVVVP